MIQAGKPVIEEFLGRDVERKKLSLMLNNSQSVVLIAPRRFGKTSLANRVLKDLESSHPALKIDIMESPNIRVLAEKIIDECYRVLGIKGYVLSVMEGTGKLLKNIINTFSKIGTEIDGVNFALTEDLLKSSDDLKILEHALKMPNSIAKALNKKIIFYIDELGEIRDYKNYKEILKLMRSHFQKQEDVTYLFSGSQFSVINEIFKNQSAPFYNFAEILNLSPMKEEDFKEYFIELFQKNNIVIPNDFSKNLVNATSGIPYYTIKVANTILFRSLINKTEVFNYSIAKGIYDTFKSEQDFFIRELSKTRGKQYKIKILQAISRKMRSSEIARFANLDLSNLTREINSLERDGYISKKGNGVFSFNDPFLSLFLSRNY